MSNIIENMRTNEEGLVGVLCNGFDVYLSELADMERDWYGKGHKIPVEKIVERQGSIKELKASFVTNLFGITTYDGQLDYEFGVKIIEVMKAILKRETYNYIKNKKKYRDFILVANLLENNDWIEWGGSIRGAWFDSYGEDATFPNGMFYELEGKFPIDNPNGGASKNIETLLDFFTNDKYKTREVE